MQTGNPDQTSIDEYRKTPQFFASQNDFEGLKSYFQNKSPRDPIINQQNARQHTALYCAARVGNIEMVKS